MEMVSKYIRQVMNFNIILEAGIKENSKVMGSSNILMEKGMKVNS